MSNHFGTLCIKGLRAVTTVNSLISGGLDSDRIVCFIFLLLKNTPNLLTTLGLEILWTHFVKNTNKFQKNPPPPPHPLCGAPLHWLYFTSALLLLWESIP